MNRFKKILLSLHGEKKDNLGKIYQDKQVYISSVRSSAQPVEEARIFSYGGLSFWLCGTGRRNKERMELLVSIPDSCVPMSGQGDNLPIEDFLLRLFSPEIKEYSAGMENSNKDAREKARFLAQDTNECIRKRNGLMYDLARNAFILKILFYMPLINGSRINAKSGLKAVRGLLEKIKERLDTLDVNALGNWIAVYNHQSEIWKWLVDNSRIAFVANGSILPRRSEASEADHIVPFMSPESVEETICFSDGTKLTGMAVPSGVTVITGGGYSGKSTLLDALEAGVWRHIPGDGREYVLSLPESEKIYAEFGRTVHELDISPFFEYMPNGSLAEEFSTSRASGSVSQAAGIIEAVYAGSRVLLIDEDTSATNFMIRDAKMRRLIKKEPIIPFTDRVRLLYEREGVSSVLVIGGSGEYLSCADRILMMEDYRLTDVTREAKALVKEKPETVPGNTRMDVCRYMQRDEQNPLFFCRQIHVENFRGIWIDGYFIDVSKLTALSSEYQLYMLAYALETLLYRNESLGECRNLAEILCNWDGNYDKLNPVWEVARQFPPFFEQVRPIDLLAAIFRMPCSTLFQRKSDIFKPNKTS